jgi:hypothetical protein
LTDLANKRGCDTWDEEAEGKEYMPLTRMDSIDRLMLTGIDLSENGCYSLWYSDTDIFLGTPYQSGWQP